MDKQFYMMRSRMTPITRDLMVEGYPITIGEDTYERLIKRPKGRRVLRRLQNLTKDVQITIYG